MLETLLTALTRALAAARALPLGSACTGPAPRQRTGKQHRLILVILVIVGVAVRVLEFKRKYAKVGITFGDVHEETQDARERAATIEEVVDCGRVRSRKRGTGEETKGSARRRKTQRSPGSTDRPPR